MSPKLKVMRLAPVLLVAVSSLGLVACGSMSEYERPEVPLAPLPTPAAPQSAYAAEEVEAQDTTPASAETFEDTDPSAITDFKPTLDQHGTWSDDPNYGTVWVPARERVGADFTPYVTAGHWALDPSDNYVWVSDYDDQFGWVVFHYGRWVWTSNSGWVWVPGRRYAPAWVVWRAGDPGYGYVGWAPMPPGYYWRSNHVIWMSSYPPAPYVFVSTTYVFHEHVHTHLASREEVPGIASHTRPYGAPGGDARHVLATPHQGPSASSGHIPTLASPGTHYQQHFEQSRFSSPRGMNRVPAANDLQRPRTSPSHFTSQAPGHSPGPLPQPSHQRATPQPSAPTQRTLPPVQHSAPPQRSSPPPQRSSPPVQHSAPSHSSAPTHTSKPSVSVSHGRGRR